MPDAAQIKELIDSAQPRPRITKAELSAGAASFYDPEFLDWLVQQSPNAAREHVRRRRKAPEKAAFALVDEFAKARRRWSERTQDELVAYDNARELREAVLARESEVLALCTAPNQIAKGPAWSRMIENFEKKFDAMTPAELLDTLGTSVRSDAEMMELKARMIVRRLRDRAITWAAIGEALGVTRQSAWERFASALEDAR